MSNLGAYLRIMWKMNLRTNLRTNSRTSFNLEDKLGGEPKDELEDELGDELGDKLKDNLEDANRISFSATLRLRTLVEVAYFGGYTAVFSY